MRGHQRNASDTKEFHEVTKRDALMHFELELKTLLNTISNDELRHFKSKEMERFATLFGRFLQEEGPSVEWDKIQKLPTDAVKDYATLSAPKDNEAVSVFIDTSNMITTAYWHGHTNPWLQFISDSSTIKQIGGNKIEWWSWNLNGLSWTKKCDPRTK